MKCSYRSMAEELINISTLFSRTAIRFANNSTLGGLAEMFLSVTLTVESSRASMNILAGMSGLALSAMIHPSGANIKMCSFPLLSMM